MLQNRVVIDTDNIDFLKMQSEEKEDLRTDPFFMPGDTEQMGEGPKQDGDSEYKLKRKMTNFKSSMKWHVNKAKKRKRTIN